MRIGDILYFSPRFKFADLNLADTQKVVEAFRDRIEGFYLRPAFRLLDAGDAFAGGLLCCVSIEVIAKFSGNVSPSIWLQNNVEEFAVDRRLADRFWSHYRDGLAHEGRIRHLGQFSLESPEMIRVAGPVLVVNPRLLLETIRTAFNASYERLDPDGTARLINHLSRYFRGEIEAAVG